MNSVFSNVAFSEVALTVWQGGDPPWSHVRHCGFVKISSPRDHHSDHLPHRGAPLRSLLMTRAIPACASLPSNVTLLSMENNTHQKNQPISLQLAAQPQSSVIHPYF